MSATMNEYVFDIDHWLPMFPLEEEDDELMTSGHGPEALCYLEQVRRRAAALGDMGRTVPTDIFALALGEPERRDVTKFGGVPYRPANRPWPVSSENGLSMTFVAQFRFTESRDIVGQLPGDILLAFFVDSGAAPYDWFPGPPVFEWYPLGLTNLIQAEDMPSIRPFVPPPPACYGVRYRTVDYLDERAAELIAQVIPDPAAEEADNPDAKEWVEKVRESAVRQYCHASSFKIGGVPYWDWEDPKRWKRKASCRGSFFAPCPRSREIPRGATHGSIVRKKSTSDRCGPGLRVASFIFSWMTKAP